MEIFVNFGMYHTEFCMKLRNYTGTEVNREYYLGPRQTQRVIAAAKKYKKNPSFADSRGYPLGDTLWIDHHGCGHFRNKWGYKEFTV